MVVDAAMAVDPQFLLVVVVVVVVVAVVAVLYPTAVAVHRT